MVNQLCPILTAFLLGRRIPLPLIIIELVIGSGWP